MKVSKIDINIPIVYSTPKTPSVEDMSQEAYKRVIKEIHEGEAHRVVVEKELVEFYKNQKTSEPPNIATMAKTFTNSMGDWIRSGFSVVTEEQLQKRLEICSGCEFWDKSAFVGTGKCKKCGCSTQAKLRLATEKCPIDKWLPIEKEEQVNAKENQNAQTEETQSTVPQQADGSSQEPSPEVQG